MFCAVWVGIAAGQVIIVQVGSVAMKVASGGLPWEHWLIAIGCGLMTWPVGLVIKLIPDTWCPQFGTKSKNPLEDEDKSILSLRKKRTQSFSLRQPGGINKEGSGAGRQGSLRNH